jgi:hypothetical protein
MFHLCPSYITSTHGMQQAYRHKNTTHAEHIKGNYTDFNFGVNCASEKRIDSDRDSAEGATVPPTNFRWASRPKHVAKIYI